MASSRTAANQSSRQARTTSSGSTRATASSEGWSALHEDATTALRRHAPSPCENSLLKDEVGAHPVAVAGAGEGEGEGEWMADMIHRLYKYVHERASCHRRIALPPSPLGAARSSSARLACPINCAEQASRVVCRVPAGLSPPGAHTVGDLGFAAAAATPSGFSTRGLLLGDAAGSHFLRFAAGRTSRPRPDTFFNSECEAWSRSTRALSDHLARIAAQSLDLVKRPVATDHSSSPWSVEPRVSVLIIEWQT